MKQVNSLSRRDPENDSRHQAQSASRRKTVFAASHNPTDDKSPTDVHPKSSSEIKKLRAILKSIPILAALDDQALHQVILAMENRSVNVGEVIIKEGEEGDYFYVIESGSYEASHTIKNNKAVIHTYTDGGYFGELSLLHDQPRCATITAKTSGKLWALSQKNFKKTVVQSDYKRRVKYHELISKVEILQNLNEDERNKLSEALETKSFTKGQTIILQGEVADGMYFIEQGTVIITATNNEVKNVTIKTLKPGDYFGELALLTHQTRAATAIADSDVIVAFLNVDAFERLLGSCDNIMRRNVKTYEKQMKKLLNAPQGTLRK